MGNIVAIVGRPNVGKSTLYNRLVERRDAIIDNVSGVTRDRKYGVCEWNGKKFTVIDTGGFVKDSEDIFETAIRDQVAVAIQEATVIVFVTDTTTGITDLDEEVANMLRRTKKDVFLAVNKVDNGARMLEANEFYSMGFDNLFFIAALTGSGTGDLLDAITEKVDEYIPNEEDIPKIAIIGQPNVGKSSLTNALLGEERNIVTNIAGTTRDSIHSYYNKFGHEFMLVDTAGIRKKSKVHEDLEFYSVMRAINALEECDVCLLVLDATDGIESQDMSLFHLAHRRNKGIVVLINKWDLVEKNTNTARDYEKEVRERLRPFDDVPILFISVLEKQRLFKVVEAAMEVVENRKRKITTSQLNETMLEIIKAVPPPTHRAHQIKIKYVMQLPTYYPAFAFFCNHPKHVKDSYRNFLENKLRENYNFKGVPISVFFREK
jgi:GTP-binding protein